MFLIRGLPPAIIYHLYIILSCPKNGKVSFSHQYGKFILGPEKTHKT